MTCEVCSWELFNKLKINELRLKLGDWHVDCVRNGVSEETASARDLNLSEAEENPPIPFGTKGKYIL